MSIEYPCVHWNEGKCKKFSDDKVTSWCCESPCKDQTPSNADRIRAMSDEELISFFVLEDKCPKNISSRECDGFESCKDCWVHWLKQPAE